MRRCSTRLTADVRPAVRKLAPAWPLLVLLICGSAANGAALPSTIDTPAGDSQAAPSFDVLVVGGRVFDGTGNPWFVADIGIRGDVIAAVGDLSAARAPTVIDASGRLVVPGFIDIHSHADEGRISLANPDAAAAPNLVTQGITTVVVGQDGRCQCPVGERAELYRAQGIGLNVVQLVGHGTIRQQVMGREQREATTEEIEQMAALVRQAMEEGAAGLSSGLEYNPGRFSVTVAIGPSRVTRIRSDMAPLLAGEVSSLLSGRRTRPGSSGPSAHRSPA